MNFDPFKLHADLNVFTIKKRWAGIPKGPRKTEAEPVEEAPEETAAPKDEEKSKVVVRNPKWEAETVGFNEETEVSVEVELPPEHANKKKVLFELYAKTPADPERISQGEGFEEAGKAKCKIPVYQPQYKDENGELLQKVDYYFTAKHSQSDLLKDEKAIRTVDGKAERVIETHVIEDTTFDFDRSFLHPRNAAGLKALMDRIKGWREKYPDGMLAVFGHTDAVGKESYNKGLSERRAKSLHAFLIKDVAVWEKLNGEEKWGLAELQELLKHLGHDPGIIDGQDGPKTQAALKDFQGKNGVPADGKNSAKTREALFKAYAEGLNQLTLDKKIFEDINGSPFAGCSEFNLLEDVQGSLEKNRRVTVLLLKSTKKFPVNYPCKLGDLAPCKSQVKKNAGKRRKPSFKCCFYDELVKEEGAPDGPEGDLPDYDAGADFDTGHGCVLAEEECFIPGGSEASIHGAEWNVEKARCGGTVKITAHSTLPEGTPVSIRISTKTGKCGEAKAAVKAGLVELEWKVTGIGVAMNDQKQMLPEVEVTATLDAGGDTATTAKVLLVQTINKTEPAAFDKNYTWGIYSVHAQFTQKVWGRNFQVHVKKKVLKAWGATYVNLKDAGIKDSIAGIPWAGHRWAKSKTGFMVPDQYWDGKAWKSIPDGVLDDPQNFGAMPLIKDGDAYHHPGDKTIVWPEAMKDYDFDAQVYKGKRDLSIADCKRRWSGVWKIRRKGCTSNPKLNCCTYETGLEFEMEKTESFDNDTLCLAPGNLRSNAGLLFYGETRVSVAAHEVGHLVGLPDEYPGGAVDTAATGDGLKAGIDSTTLMGGDGMSEANCKIKKRHYSNFLDMAKRIYKDTGGAEQEWVAV